MTGKKDSLTKILLEDIKTSANLSSRKIITWIIDTFGNRPAGWLADQLVKIDDQLAESSLHETANRAICLVSDGLAISNAESIPETGPLLVVSNHPGFFDILGIVAALDREDVKIVSQQKEFMRVLGNINRHMLTLEPDSTFKLETIREIIRCLNEGMAVIIFPSGQLEPDPAIVPGAVESLKSWSDSIGVFLNKVPETCLLPVLVSGVLIERAFNSGMAKLGWNQKRRQQFAMAAQFIGQTLSKKPHWKRPLQIDFGQPKSPEELDPDLDPRNFNMAVKQEMLDLLEKSYPEQGSFEL